MGKYLFLVVSTLYTLSAFAATPYSPEVNKRFKAIEASTSKVGSASNGLGYLKVARVSFDSTTQGTSSSTAYSLGATLPAKSVIWDGMIYVTSTFTSAGSVAIECEDSGNILATKLASSFGATGASVALLETGTPGSARVGIGAACAISAKVTGANVVGKFVAWIFYFVHD